MGLRLSRVMSYFLFSKQNLRILMVGLDAAGKTTILYSLKFGEVQTTVPTIGFNVETVEYKNICFTVHDIGGQDKLRPLWRHYFEGTQGLIFVVDSNDRDRIDLAAQELQKMLSEDALQNVVILIYANKQDLPYAMRPAEVAQKLGIKEHAGNREWNVQACSATSGPNGEGLIEGLEWLSKTLKKYF